ncbi:MAG TPA: ribonuclease E/G [Chakrabartia sp.]|nr:ribonuclease E/G [Chakrabartia sp.]
MTMRMLIDARHREETRVAVIKGNRIEEFDFESAEHKQLKGNIYLAKVTRVEPSLQAAFVDYGGNRHGFLAFSEIHPDYYQIPKEDREALLREEAEHAAEEARRRDAENDLEPVDGHHDDDGQDHDRPDSDMEPSEDEEAPRSEDVGGDHGHDEHGSAREFRAKRTSLRRRYKIQDVIHRRQVLLVQVVKEERGNKGAALTTYLSLAGRYCVLMPNSTHGGGISRKISNAADRKRLKSILSDMNLPSTMGCIVRTAGLQRTKTEIKRDFDYLARLWDGIRENTLKSVAPALIHNDSDLIKRAIRDIYNKDIDEVVVEGEAGYKAARDYMKLLMPSHAKRVKPYADVVSLYQRYGVEDQLAAMYNPVVQLKSGGYIVINPTEALVSIDINSGRSTREYGIEQTAIATNLEAADEIARQLRLRDMAGLVVIDFIDMEHGSNVRKVEKAMKSALANDRARIQVGRISSFGLMEMSRQRLRTGVLEASTRECPHCEGTGLVRTASSSALSALRLLEEEAARGNGTRLTLRASQEAAIYVLNRKRAELNEIEDRYGVFIDIVPDGETEGARMIVESSGPPPLNRPKFEPIILDDDDDVAAIEDDVDEEEAEERAGDEPREEGEGGRRKRSRRRRGRRNRRDGEEQGEQQAEDAAEGEEGGAAEEGDTVEAGEEAPRADGEEEGEPRRRGRRGRRGGRRNRGEAVNAEGVDAAEDAEAETPAEDTVVAEAAPEEVAAEEAPAKPKRTRRKKADVDAEAVADDARSDEVPAELAAEAPAKPKRTRKKKADIEAEAVADDAPAAEEAPAKPKRTRKKKVDAPAVAVEAEPAASPAPEPVAEDVTPSEPAAPDVAASAETADAAPEAEADGPAEPARRGWWQRTFGA